MRSVVVTGGTVRLGKVIADLLAEEGWHVLRSSHFSRPEADIVADLSRDGGADELFFSACEMLGATPDAIVNNAGVFSGDEKVLEAVNYSSPRRLTDLMGENGGKAVVHVLDSRVLAGSCDSFYSQTKARLLSALCADAKRYAGKLRLNAVAPGPVMASSLVHESAGITPLGRPTADDVAQAVLFLLSAKHTSGCVIPVDGAQSLI